MTTKRHWLNSICHDTQDFCTQQNISWSNSDSSAEDEYNDHTGARKKKNKYPQKIEIRPKENEDCIQSDKFLLSSTISINNTHTSPTTLHQKTYGYHRKISPIITVEPRKKHCNRTNSKECRSFKSPPTNSFELEDMSPDLGHQTDENCCVHSPIFAAVSENPLSNFSPNKGNVNLEILSPCIYQKRCTTKNNDSSLNSPILGLGLRQQRDMINDSKSNYILGSYDGNIDTKLKNSSSVINQSNSIRLKNKSPILGQISLLKKTRSKYNERRMKIDVFQISPKSPDLFPSQSTQLIEHDESPEFNKSANITNSNTSQSSECIENFPSQQIFSQNLNDNCNLNEDNTLDVANSSFLYHQPIRKKRKYRNDGLASLLHKTLHLQKTRIAIWQHEVYTNKLDFIGVEGEVIQFSLKREWKEYGHQLFECDTINVTNMSGSIISSSSKSESIEDKNMFIIVLSLNSHLNISYKINQRYKLFPPYTTKSICYKTKNISCHYNVTKVISL